MYSIRQKTKFLLTAAALSALTACGGSSSNDMPADNSAEDNASQPQAVSKTQFDSIMTKTGTWIASFDIGTSYSFALDLDGQQSNVDFDLTAYAASPLYLNYISDTQVETGTCSALQPVTTDSPTFNNQFNEASVKEIFLKNTGNSDISIAFCPQGIVASEQYYMSDAEDNYRIDYYCSDEKIGSVGLKQVSQDIELSEGTLSFSSPEHGDLEATSPNSCGSLGEFGGVVRVNGTEEQAQTISANSSYISVAANYGDSRISFNFAFSKTLLTGDYQVASQLSAIGDLDSSLVFVTITSPEFGGSSDFPVSLTGMTGSVSITEVTDLEAAGNFTLTTDTNETFTGSFSFDYY